MACCASTTTIVVESHGVSQIGVHIQMQALELLRELSGRLRGELSA